jgi:protein-disulfide isomerase
MKKETAIAAIIVFAVLAFVGGYFLGGYAPQPGGHGGAEGEIGNFDSNVIPIGDSPTEGSPSAAATIVLFLDFTGSSSQQTGEYVQQVASDDRFASDIRTVVKVLPGRGNRSRRAAATALYASEHGEFEAVYDELMDADSLNRDSLRGIIEGVGLDVEHYETVMEEGTYDAAIDADVNLARSLGISSAPAVVVNGRTLTSQSLAVGPIREAVFGEIEAADELASGGHSASQIYALRVRANASPEALVAAGGRGEGEADRPSRRTRNADRAEARERPTPTAAPTPAAEPGDIERLQATVGDSVFLGPADALVTIVEFSDFHCPFCGRVEPAITTLREEFGDDLRIVWKHNPLPMHAGAPEAHLATLAAADQGQFWEMHGRMFEDRARDLAAYQAIAADLGLDMAAFNAYIENETGQDQIDADMAMARTLSARGTPHFFINGRRLRGAQPVERFREIITEELETTRALVAGGIAREDIYEHLMEGATEQAAAPTPSAPAAPEVVDPPPVGNSATLGPDDAPVTIFIFSEFQCPYCGRAQPALDQIREEYGDRVQLVFKSFPLPFHSDANLASQAALAAGEQGQFWEYHDILFQNQRALSRSDLESYAERLNLDMGEFRAALDDGRHADQIDRETAEGRRAGVSGTPTFVVNGTRIVGAVPFSRFQPVIDAALN